MKQLMSLAAVLTVAGSLAGCADDASNLIVDPVDPVDPIDPVPCVLNCTPTPPPPPTSLEDCNPNNPNARFAPITSNVSSVDVGTEGVCVNCRVASPTSAFDGNLGTFSAETAGVGVFGTLNLSGRGPRAYETSPTVLRRIGFFVAYPADSVADVALLSNARAFTVDADGVQVQGPGEQTLDTALSLQLLGLPLLEGQSLAFVSVVTSQPFNGARLDFTPSVGVLAGLNVIEACISR